MGGKNCTGKHVACRSLSIVDIGVPQWYEINIAVYLCAPFPVLCMRSEIIHEFADSPSQSRVVRFLLENGFGVTEDGRISCNGIEFSATAVAKAMGSDRRVVDSTARRILERPSLRKIFINLRATPDLTKVGESLGYTVITVLPKNANEHGIVGAAVRVLADNDLSIRQIFVTDPQLSEYPKLVIIVEEQLPVGIIEEIRGLSQVRQVII
ncbi:MAG: hypothetical protein METHP_02086 [Methanoregula sp. SKADARSKE-2]|nr:MAG: hypothetical protein METHP_02086 [Methanoregula sp. SKADARSKE-2]